MIIIMNSMYVVKVNYTLRSSSGASWFHTKVWQNQKGGVPGPDDSEGSHPMRFSKDIIGQP
jgi:hypothetical protein